jgi:hypothetical protein
MIRVLRETPGKGCPPNTTSVYYQSAPRAPSCVSLSKNTGGKRGVGI